MPECDHLNKAIGRLQRRLVSQKRYILGLDVLLGVVLVGLVITGIIKLAGWPLSILWVYSVILLLAFIVFIWLAWPVHVSPETVLIQADRSLQLKECLSTAYEYRRDTGNPFVMELMARADRIATQVDAKLVFPRHLPHRVWIIPLLLVALVGFVMFDVAPLRFGNMSADEMARNPVQQGKPPHERKGWEHLAREEQREGSLIQAGDRQKARKRTRGESAEKSRADQLTSEFSLYFQRMQEEMQKRALAGETSIMMNPNDGMAVGKNVRQQLQDILSLLRHDDMPQEMLMAVEQGIRQLTRRPDLKPEMERLLQSLRSGNIEGARRLLEDAIKQEQTTEGMRLQQRAKQAQEYSWPTLKDAPPDKATTGFPPDMEDPFSGERPFDTSGQMRYGNIPEGEDFGLSGFSEGFGYSPHSRKGEEQLLNDPDRPMEKVQSKSDDDGAWRLDYIRYLPKLNQAREPLGRVMVRYQHAAEEVLTQEDIPRGYREEVKQYFLAIGMVGQERE